MKPLFVLALIALAAHLYTHRETKLERFQRATLKLQAALEAAKDDGVNMRRDLERLDRYIKENKL